MASFGKHITFFFLLVLLSSSVQIQARESKFFSKIFHLGAKISSISKVPTASPTPAPAPAPASANSESQDPYYGLYGQGSGMFPPAKETAINTPTTTTTFEDDLLAEELAAEDEKYETGYETNNYSNNRYSSSNYNNNRYSSSNYNNNGHILSNYNNNGYNSNFNTNGYSNNYKSNGYSNNYKSNGYGSSYNNEYETERQGMSDTRFVEGGKYYYDVKNENYYPNGYESGKETTKNEGYFGNTEKYSNSNEFNSMEEFQNKKSQCQESQEEYVP